MTSPFPSLPEHRPLSGIVRGGGGRDIVLLHGFGLLPRTYARTTDLLAVNNRVLVPHWLSVDGAWTYERALAGVRASIEDARAERIVLVGHSFGGAIALGLAARFPDLVDTLILSDSNALGPRWRLARSVVAGMPFIRLATYRTAVDFFASWREHSPQLARAGWWAFHHSIDEDVRAVAAVEDMRRFVLWAERDTLLHRDDGQEFADAIGAQMHCIDPPEEGGPVDHDWVYRHPALFVSMLERLGVPTPLSEETVAYLTEDAVV